LRLGLDPNNKNPNAVAVWSGTRDLFLGYLTPTAADRVSDWLRQGGARAYSTVEWLEAGQRTNIGVLCVPASSIEVKFLGDPLPTFETALANAREKAEAVAARSREIAAAYAAATKPTELAKFTSLLAKSSDEKATIKDVEKLSFLSGELLRRLEDVLETEEESTDTGAAVEILSSFGFVTQAAQLTEDVLEDFGGDLDLLESEADGYIDEWSDADKEERDDLRTNLAIAADDVLAHFPTKAAQPVTNAAASSASPQLAAHPAALPPAGWYPNPGGTGQRYWDGQGWTEHVAP